MTKLWEVTVNNWGWDSPETFFFRSRKEAQKCRNEYPAADPVKYSGNYTDENASILLEDTDNRYN